MAMLAERRQRKRYNLLSRGKALYEDDSRFGTKMLEKMGWSKGKGLGANEDGSVDFVRVRYKNDPEGLGYEIRDDQWTNHGADFNGFLTYLNSETVHTVPEVTLSNDVDLKEVGVGFCCATESFIQKGKLKDKISGESLEEKSKRSRARVHYKKFTKEKDLAQYSEKDLASIFGKKMTKTNPIEDNLTKICNTGETNKINSEATANGNFKQKTKKRSSKIESCKMDGELHKISDDNQSNNSTIKKFELDKNIEYSQDVVISQSQAINNSIKSTIDVKFNNIPRENVNSYTISSYSAEKFRKTDLYRFVGSNLSNITGYSFDGDLKLEIKNIARDEARINRLWNCTLNKYFDAFPENKYENNVEDVQKASKANQELPKFNVGKWRRRKAFPIL